MSPLKGRILRCGGSVLFSLLLLGAAPPGYVDDAACASCHTDIARSYREVGMARAFSKPRKDALIEDLGKEFVHAPSKQTFQMIWRDGRLLFRRWQRDAAGNATHLFEQPVDWMLGSGDHARVYLYQTPEGELYQLPIAWYAQMKSWGMAPGYDKPDHDGVSRRVRHECMFCHNAYPDVVPSGDGFWRSQAFPKQLPEGIGCQRCHGPGAAHTAAMRAKQDDDTIVNPARLAPARRDDACDQCHLLPAVAVQGARRLGRDVYSYRPGEALADYELATDIDTSGPERFEISHQSYRMKKSRCFRESEGRLSCLTCHDPHRAIPAPERAAHFRRACLGCHEKMTVAGKEHARETREQFDCTSCHMPKRRTQDVVHVVMTDHRIGKFSGDLAQLVAPLEESEPEVENVRLYAAPATTKPAEQTAYRLLPLLRTGHTSDPRLVPRLAEAIAMTSEVEPLLDLANAQAGQQQWTKLSQTAQTILWRAPSHPLGLAWLGLAQQGQGKQEDALASLRKAVALLPERAGLHMNLATALLRGGKEDEALAELQRAVALRPNLAGAWLQLADLYARRKEPAKAEEAKKRALAINPPAR